METGHRRTCVVAFIHGSHHPLLVPVSHQGRPGPRLESDTKLGYASPGTEQPRSAPEPKDKVVLSVPAEWKRAKISIQSTAPMVSVSTFPSRESPSIPRNVPALVQNWILCVITAFRHFGSIIVPKKRSLYMGFGCERKYNYATKLWWDLR